MGGRQSRYREFPLLPIPSGLGGHARWDAGASRPRSEAEGAAAHPRGNGCQGARACLGWRAAHRGARPRPWPLHRHQPVAGVAVPGGASAATVGALDTGDLGRGVLTAPMLCAVPEPGQHGGEAWEGSRRAIIQPARHLSAPTIVRRIPSPKHAPRGEPAGAHQAGAVHPHARRHGSRVWRHRHQSALHPQGSVYRTPQRRRQPRQRARDLVARVLVADEHRHAEVRGDHHARRQPRRGRHHGAHCARPSCDPRPEAALDADGARPVRRRPFLRRQHDHSRDLGAVRGRGARSGDAGAASPTSCRWRSRC